MAEKIKFHLDENVRNAIAHRNFTADEAITEIQSLTAATSIGRDYQQLLNIQVENLLFSLCLLLVIYGY